MDNLDDLLAGLAPRTYGSSPAVERELRNLLARATAPRARLRIPAIAAIVVALLASGTAATAGSIALSDLLREKLGYDADASYEFDLSLDGVGYHCQGGIVVLPQPDRPDYVEKDFTRVRDYVRAQDWSGLTTDASYLGSQARTPDNLVNTIGRQIMAQAASDGLPLTSVSTRGTGECQVVPG